MLKKLKDLYDLFRLNDSSRVLSPFTGTVVPSKLVNNVNIAYDVAGISMGVLPESNIVKSPFKGHVAKISRFHNALSISNDNMQMILNIGLYRDKYNSDLFDLKVKEGDEVLEGQTLMIFNHEELSKIDRNFLCTLTIRQNKGANSINLISIKKVDFDTILVNYYIT